MAERTPTEEEERTLSSATFKMSEALASIGEATRALKGDRPDLAQARDLWDEAARACLSVVDDLDAILDARDHRRE